MDGVGQAIFGCGLNLDAVIRFMMAGQSTRRNDAGRLEEIAGID